MREYLDGLNKFIDGVDDNIMEETKDAFQYYQDKTLIPITPIDTGELVSSYNDVKIEGKSIIISNKADHSKRILWWASAVFGEGTYSKKLPDGMRPSLIDFINKEGGDLRWNNMN